MGFTLAFNLNFILCCFEHRERDLTNNALLMVNLRNETLGVWLEYQCTKAFYTHSVVHSGIGIVYRRRLSSQNKDQCSRNHRKLSHTSLDVRLGNNDSSSSGITLVYSSQEAEAQSGINVLCAPLEAPSQLILGPKAKRHGLPPSVLVRKLQRILRAGRTVLGTAAFHLGH